MNFQQQFKKHPQGFSLVELLVVIAIIAILSVVAYTSFSGATDQAKDSKNLDNLAAIVSALEIYKTNEGVYPDELVTGEVADGHIPKTYLSKIPKDPAGHDYLYAKQGSTFQVSAVLRKDGDPAHFETHVDGNGTDLLKTNGTDVGFYYDGADLVPCTQADITIVEGQVSTDDGQSGSCLPYDPTVKL